MNQPSLTNSQREKLKIIRDAFHIVSRTERTPEEQTVVNDAKKHAVTIWNLGRNMVHNLSAEQAIFARFKHLFPHL